MQISGVFLLSYALPVSKTLQCEEYHPLTWEKLPLSHIPEHGCSILGERLMVSRLRKRVSRETFSASFPHCYYAISRFNNSYVFHCFEMLKIAATNKDDEVGRYEPSVKNTHFKP